MFMVELNLKRLLQKEEKQVRFTGCTRSEDLYMKVAVIADIHANLEALEAALIAIERDGIDRIICLGDIVGYGPDPLGCIYRLQEVEALVLMGNHDQAIINPQSIRSFNSNARPSLIYAFECIGEEERDLFGRVAPSRRRP